MLRMEQRDGRRCRRGLSRSGRSHADGKGDGGGVRGRMRSGGGGGRRSREVESAPGSCRGVRLCRRRRPSLAAAASASAACLAPRRDARTVPGVGASSKAARVCPLGLRSDAGRIGAAAVCCRRCGKRLLLRLQRKSFFRRRRRLQRGERGPVAAAALPGPGNAVEAQVGGQVVVVVGVVRVVVVELLRALEGCGGRRRGRARRGRGSGRSSSDSGSVGG